MEMPTTSKRSRVRGGAALALATALALSGVVIAAPRSDESDSSSAAASSMTAQEFFALKRAPAGQSVPVERYSAARQQIESMRTYSTASRGFAGRTGSGVSAQSATPSLPNIGTWGALGPNNLGGRVRALVVDPTVNTTWYAGGVAGGVWKTTNSGTSWSAIGDSFANMAVSALAINPANNQWLLAGTGEGYFNSDAARGNGLFYSKDAGATWLPVTVTSTCATATQTYCYINDILWSSSGYVYIATSTGVYRWAPANVNAQFAATPTALPAPTYILNPPPASGTGTITGGCLDIVKRPSSLNSDTLLVSCGTNTQAKVFRALNGTTATNVITTTAPGATTNWFQSLSEVNMGRTSLAVAGAAGQNDQIIYALSADSANGSLHAVKRSADGGTSWTQAIGGWTGTDITHELLSNAYSDLCVGAKIHQGAYANSIAVEPTDTSGATVYVGGVDLWVSGDSGVTWHPVSSWWEQPASPNYNLHANQHALVFQPTTNTLLIANDGGVAKMSTVGVGTTMSCPGLDTINSTAAFTNLNNGLGITQFYGGAVNGSDTSYIGGTEGLGTVSGSDGAPSAWTQIFGVTQLSDVLDPVNGAPRTAGLVGSAVAIDPSNPNVVFAETPNNTSRFVKSTDGGATWDYGNSGISDTGFLYVTPLAMDPSNSQRLWTGGTYIWRTDDQSVTNWKKVNTTGLTGGTAASAIAVAPSDPNVVFVGTGPTSTMLAAAGNIYRTTNGLSTTPTWTSGAVRASAYVSSIAFDPYNAQVAYATYSTFGTGHVYKTTNGGTTWAISDGTGSNKIPDIPVHSIVVDPGNTQRLYVGTDLGVFVTIDGGANWAKEITGFANAVTEQLVINGSNLYAFTHGRGVWRVPLTGTAPTVTVGFTTSGKTLLESAGPAVLTVKLSTADHAATTSQVTVDYSTLDGTALAGPTKDYQAVAGTLTFPAGTAHGATQTISVPLVNDSVGEVDESFKVNLSNVTGGARVGQATSTVVIHDDGDLPGISISDVAVNETATSAVFTVSLSVAPTVQTTVNWATQDGTATAAAVGSNPADYTTASGVLTFPIGTTSKNITVLLKTDTVAEPTENFFVNLSSPNPALSTITKSQGVATITDNDVSGSVQFSLPTYTVSEAGPSATIAVTRTGGTASGVTVDYVVDTPPGTATNGACATAGSDYTLVPGTLTFGSAIASMNITIPICNDTIVDAGEFVNLKLQNVGGYGATIGSQSTAVLNITDNDVAGTLAFSAATYAGVEPATGTTTVNVTVKRTGGAASGVTVDYGVDLVTPGTATSGADYNALGGTLTFNANVTSLTFPVVLKADSPNNLVEIPDETINLVLSNPTGGGALAAPSAAVFSIADSSPKIQFATANYNPSETAASVVLTATRTGPTAATVVVPWHTTDGTAISTGGTATDPVDFTAASGVLTFGAGIISKTITITLKPDTIVEGNQTFTVTLDNPTAGGVLGAISTANVNITDDDKGGAFEFTYTALSSPGVAALSAQEPTGTLPLHYVVTVKRTGGVASNVMVDYAEGAAGTATAGSDYNVVAGTLTFAAGIASKTFTVDVLPDTVPEGYKTFNLTLSNPQNGGSLGTVKDAVVTIVDAQPVVMFSAPTFNVTEGTTATVKATINLKRTGALTAALDVNVVDLLTGTATPGGDYVLASPKLVHFAAAVAATSFTIDISPDHLVELTETVNLGLQVVTAGTNLGPQQTATLNIVDDEPVVSFNVASYTVTEQGPSVIVAVKRTGTLAVPVTVGLLVNPNGTDTAVAGTDYGTVPVSVTLPAASAGVNVTIPIINDFVYTGNRAFSLKLDAASLVAGGFAGAGTIGAINTTTVNITENEPTIQLSAAAYSVSEPANTATVDSVFTITVTRGSGILTQVSTVDYVIGGGTATLGTDYSMNAPLTTSGTLSFASGIASMTIKVNIKRDTLHEGNENFTVTLSNATKARLGTNQVATVTIVDND
jgi:hypothetical protein